MFRDVAVSNASSITRHFIGCHCMLQPLLPPFMRPQLEAHACCTRVQHTTCPETSQSLPPSYILKYTGCCKQASHHACSHGCPLRLRTAVTCRSCGGRKGGCRRICRRPSKMPLRRPPRTPSGAGGSPSTEFPVLLSAEHCLLSNQC